MTTPYASGSPYNVWLRTNYSQYINTLNASEREPFPQLSIVDNLSNGWDGTNLKDKIEKVSSGWPGTAMIPNRPPTSGKRYSYAELMSNMTDHDMVNVDFKGDEGFTYENSLLFYYVPPNWSMYLEYDDDGKPWNQTVTGNGYTVHRMANNKATLKLQYVTFTRLALDPRYYPSVEENNVAMCMGHPMVIGGVQLNYARPHEEACDTLMSTFCEKNPERPECACFVEQKELQLKYDTVNVQVTCLGKTCGVYGYRTNAMMQEPCSFEWCGAFLDAVGDGIVEAGDTNIYCAGKAWEVKDSGDHVITITPSPHAAAPEDDRTPEWYTYLILALALVISALLLWLVITKTK